MNSPESENNMSDFLSTASEASHHTASFFLCSPSPFYPWLGATDTKCTPLSSHICECSPFFSFSVSILSCPSLDNVWVQNLLLSFKKPLLSWLLSPPCLVYWVRFLLRAVFSRALMDPLRVKRSSLCVQLALTLLVIGSPGLFPWDISINTVLIIL